VRLAKQLRQAAAPVKARKDTNMCVLIAIECFLLPSVQTAQLTVSFGIYTANLQRICFDETQRSYGQNIYFSLLRLCGSVTSATRTVITGSIIPPSHPKVAQGKKDEPNTMMMMMMMIIIIIIIIIITKEFNIEDGVICTMHSKRGIAATLCTVETWFVSGM
jgi:hypothetical protein